jgi:holo-[acyl-carrier protein] synthase
MASFGRLRHQVISMTPRADQVAGSLEELAATIGNVSSIGVDAVDIAGFERDLRFGGEEFLAQCFSPAEVDHCNGEVDKLATRFALKEAALKVLGTGMRGIGLHDIEIATAPSGEPRIQLSTAAQSVAADRNLGRLCCSATREAGLALAVVAAEDISHRSNAKEHS